MHKSILLCSIAVLMATPAAAAPWVRGFAVQGYEPAFYFGAKVNTTDPGTDCPKGSIPALNYKQVLKTSWRSDAEIAQMTRPASETGKDPVDLMRVALSHRGFRSDIETYINPFAAPDAGMQEVTGKIAQGFDLDGNTKTGGFTSPDGVRGVDNGYYRVFGCALSYRGPDYKAYLSQRGNDKMLDGLYTMVVRVSGTKDPMNDDNATVEVGYSPDHVIKAADSSVVSDYSYRIAKSAQYTKMKARIHNGVVETVGSADIAMPAFAWYETNRGETVFHKGRMRIVFNKDGSANGLIGGYRPWREFYDRELFNVPSGGISRETTYYENAISLYYALKRNADGLPDPKTGQNMGLSTAYRFLAKPAYVVDPAVPVVINQPAPSDRAYRERAAFMKAQLTHIPSAAPLNDHNIIKAPASVKNAPVKEMEVNNAAPATVASAAPVR